MRIFATAFAGGFFGKLAAALFIGVCAVLGFGPEEWASYLLQGLPGVVSPRAAQWGFLALAGLVALHMAWPWLSRLATRITAEQADALRSAGNGADEYDNLVVVSDAKLKELALALATQMRAFEANYMEASRWKPPLGSSEEQRHQWWVSNVTENDNLRAAHGAAFVKRFSAKALAVRNELVSRIGLPPIKKNDLQSPYHCIAIDLGGLAGAAPISQAAAVIETLARKL